MKNNLGASARPMNTERIQPCQGQTLARRLLVMRHEFRRFVLGPAVPGSTRCWVPRRRQPEPSGLRIPARSNSLATKSEPGAHLREESLRVVRQPVNKAGQSFCHSYWPLTSDGGSPTLSLRLPGTDECKTVTSGKPSGRSQCERPSRRRSNLKQTSPQLSKTDESRRPEFLRLSILWCTRVTCMPKDRTTARASDVGRPSNSVSTAPSRRARRAKR